MNKNELIDALVKKNEMKKVDAEKGLNALIDIVSDTLKAKDNVTLVGFGTFKVAHRKAKDGRNPKTGATIKIPAKDVPVFKPGKALKDKVK